MPTARRTSGLGHEESARAAQVSSNGFRMAAAGELGVPCSGSREFQDRTNSYRGRRINWRNDEEGGAPARRMTATGIPHVRI